MDIGTATHSFFNDPHCGDQYRWWENKDSVTLCMVDGLGHGIEAEKAAKAAICCVSRNLCEPLPRIFEKYDREISHTRGVAMSIVIVDKRNSVLTHAGIGNVSVAIRGRKKINLSSDWGIVGGGYRKLNTNTADLDAGDLVLMWTDGISERLDVSGYDNFPYIGTQELADLILRDHAKETDDATILIYKG
ncbi:Anti-sigma B factor RsbT [Methanosarcina horonobensis HB-1 = JCM 15518]|uniref:Anti-sigma B factor RsbT n=2 Tax=Methanosarcina horonobensis TaxID=418008 RepID=A0A0E3SCR1_9EURY|nr:SpoIIE family protein phosphatase [Methanosarcina horonobensis]AKB77123.1 Anti-sigma B factor RsbT [Methanosarcina horonobensis HB-1 = JCM 15518]